MTDKPVFTFPCGQSIEPSRLKSAANSIHAILGERKNASVKQNVDRGDKRQRTEQIAGRLSMIIDMVRAGRIKDFMFVGRDVASGHFLTEMIVDPVNPSDAFAFVGVLNALNLELTDRAQLAPALMPDGSVLDPFVEAGR